jgi:hypothetical protein
VHETSPLEAAVEFIEISSFARNFNVPQQASFTFQKKVIKKHHAPCGAWLLSLTSETHIGNLYQDLSRFLPARAAAVPSLLALRRAALIAKASFSFLMLGFKLFVSFFAMFFTPFLLRLAIYS